MLYISVWDLNNELRAFYPDGKKRVYELRKFIQYMERNDKEFKNKNYLLKKFGDLVEMFGEEHVTHFNNNRKTSFISKNTFENDKELKHLFNLKNKKNSVVIPSKKNSREETKESDSLEDTLKDHDNTNKTENILVNSSKKRKNSIDQVIPNKKIQIEQIVNSVLPSIEKINFSNVNDYILLEPKFKIDGHFQIKNKIVSNFKN